VAGLDQHLRNLSNETDSIAATLGEGEAALLRLTGLLASFGAAAGPEGVSGATGTGLTRAAGRLG
jgi:methyl-accepting chemotaxis protein